MAAQKLIYKLTVLAIVPVILSMIVFGSISFAIFKEKLVQERIEEAESLIGLSAEEIKNPLYFLELDKLNAVVQNIKKNPNVLSVYIMDANGRIITDGTLENKLYNQILKDDFTRNSIESNKILVEINNDVLQVSAPAIIDKKIGTIRIDFSLKDLDQVLINLIALLGMIGALLFIAVAAIDIFITSSLTKPITKLRNAADEIAKGNFGTEIEIRSNDEIGELAAAFNKMSGDLQRSNDEISESEEKYRNLVELTTDVIYISDREGNQVFMNDAGFLMLEASPEEVLSQPWSKWIHPDDREASIEKFMEMIEQDTDVFGFENRYVSKSGRVINVLHNVRVLKNEKGEIVGTQGIARDITDRKRAEEELRIKAQLLDRATDSIFVHDLDGNFIYMNEAAYRSRGYSKDELMQMNLREIVTPEYGKNFKQRNKQLLEKNEMVFESADFCKNGSVLPIEVHACIIESGDKKLVLSVVRDITERKQAEKMLKERARAELYGFIVSALPVFASGVPSDVRNTLVATFAERFEKHVKPRFEEEMKLLGHDKLLEEGGAEHTREVLDAFMSWLGGLFSNFGIRTRTTSTGTGRSIEFLNCPWIDEASGNPIFCFICRAITARCFTWTNLKGSADQSSSIANGSPTCRFEVHI